MSDSQSSVPKIARARPETVPPGQPKPVRLKFPSRYNARFPAPDDEPFHVNQIEFAAQYFAAVLVLFVSMGGFAAFVLVPLVGTLMNH